MSSWSKRRKTMIGAGVILLIVVAVIIPGFLIFYKAPTCFDGVKNGSETSIDCGGKCVRLCQSDFLPPSVAWSRFEELTPGLYNTASYIINPNTEGGARNVPYRISMYDNKGMLIIEKEGVVTLPPHRNTLAFKSAISVGNSKPAKVMFEFTAPPDWRKMNDSLQAIRVDDKNYSEDGTGSTLTVTLGNQSISSLDNLSVYVVLYDKDGNALGFSKTLVDEIPANGKTVAPFTWAISRNNKVVSIEVLPVAE